MKGNTKDSGIVFAGLWDEAAKRCITTHLPEVSFNSTAYKRKLSTRPRSFIKEDAVTVDRKVLSRLSPGELKLVLKIIDELKLYNALWHYDYRQIGGRAEGIISKLRKSEILFKTDSLSMHIVNPFYLHKGQISTVIAATQLLIEKNSGKDLTPKLIRDLEAPDSVMNNAFYSLSL